MQELHRGFERFCNLAAPWELKPAGQLAREATISYYTFALAALDDPQMGAVVTEDVADLEPKAAMNRYARMYAQQFVLWVEHMDSLLQQAQRELEEKLQRLGPRVLSMSQPEVWREGDMRPRLAWRMWQMSVRSGGMLGGKEIFEMMQAHFAEIGEGKCRRLAKLL